MKLPQRSMLSLLWVLSTGKKDIISKKLKSQEGEQKEELSPSTIV